MTHLTPSFFSSDMIPSLSILSNPPLSKIAQFDPTGFHLPWLLISFSEFFGVIGAQFRQMRKRQNLKPVKPLLGQLITLKPPIQVMMKAHPLSLL